MTRNDRTLRRQKTLRPTTGKVREALFNILRDRINEARFLDLYAGTGVVGIEALKQGASEVVLVEASKSSVKSIQEAVRKSRFAERIQVVEKKAASYIEWAGAKGFAFDIIFLDPPYHSDEIVLILFAIGNSPVLKEGGLVIAEHFTKKVLPDDFGALHKTKEYKYGDSVLSIYEPA